jgi:hypothetical protein
LRTQFWRCAYDGDRLADILESSAIEFPELKLWPKAKNRDSERILSDMRVGDFVLLANFDRSSEIGAVRGVGRISGVEDEIITMEWRSPRPSWGLTPDIRGGVQQWLNEAVFCFDAEPARRYKLKERTTKLFERE